jgi:hypothetical protein
MNTYYYSLFIKLTIYAQILNLAGVSNYCTIPTQMTSNEDALNLLLDDFASQEVLGSKEVDETFIVSLFDLFFKITIFKWGRE